MEIISLLGAVIDRAITNDLVWDINNKNIDIKLSTFRAKHLLEYTESLLELGDSSNVDWDKCKYITITFENERIKSVSFDEDIHDVKECVDSYIRDYNIENIYNLMCIQAISLLK